MDQFIFSNIDQESLNVAEPAVPDRDPEH